MSAEEIYHTDYGVKVHKKTLHRGQKGVILFDNQEDMNLFKLMEPMIDYGSWILVVKSPGAYGMNW